MRFGVREICDVVFKAKTKTKIGSKEFKAYQPVLYIDSATASTLEQATTAVYAQGGRGNTRLITWEGEKTLTFTVTDALLSPIGLSILSGAGLVGGDKGAAGTVHAHTVSNVLVSGNTITLPVSAVDSTAPIFITIVETDGSLTGELVEYTSVSEASITLADSTHDGETVSVDYYVTKNASDISEIQIDAASFGANFYVEASTLFRDQATGRDLPCEITLPNVKIQSNFTFNMASSGDPSTFDFVMDAMPGYTLFDSTKKVMCVMQVIKAEDEAEKDRETVMGHVTPSGEKGEVLDPDDNTNSTYVGYKKVTPGVGG